MNASWRQPLTLPFQAPHEWRQLSFMIEMQESVPRPGGFNGIRTNTTDMYYAFTDEARMRTGTEYTVGVAACDRWSCSDSIAFVGSTMAKSAGIK